MAGKEELQRWWDGLNREERVDAIRSRDAGQLSDALRHSLEDAGLIEKENRRGRAIPDEVRQHLDEQSEGPDDDQMGVSKMRH